MKKVKIYINNLNRFIEAEKDTLLTDAIKQNNLPIEMPCNGMGICGVCSLNIRPLDNKYAFQKVLSCYHHVDKDIEIEFLPVDEEIMKTADEIVGESDISESSNINVNIAIDVGTTGVSISFIDNEINEVFASKSFLNPQVKYGNDLISRIDFVSKGIENMDIARNDLLNKISDIILETLDNESIKNIEKVIFSANTTMLHIIYGANPYSISVYPYTASFLDKQTLTNADVKLPVPDSSEIILLPSASSYIGSDVVSGIYYTKLNERTDRSLFIDVGTNGEIVMNIDGKLYGSSAAAGPAFEGMNIECGSRATEGAIESFRIYNDEFVVSIIHKNGSEELVLNPDFTNLNIDSIDLSDTNSADNSEAACSSLDSSSKDYRYNKTAHIDPKSICGSGLIDLVAELLRNDIILDSGRFNKDMPEQFKSKFKDKKFYITDKVYISQKDIRQVQLAKAAISTGIKILLKDLNLEINNIDEVIIAGSFGYHLNAENLLRVGIVPKEYKNTMSFVGNTSLKGAIEACKNTDALSSMDRIAKNIEVSELSLRDDFQEVFVNEMSF